MKKKQKDKFVRDLILVVFSILIAGILIKTGSIDAFLHLFKSSYILTAFVAGILFTSIFTTAIGSAAFLVLGVDGFNPVVVGFVGGLGAMTGDMIIFKFVRNDIKADISYLFRLKKRKWFQSLADIPLMRYILPVFGGIVFASPIPDEIGVALLSVSHLSTRYFSLISFLFNAVGIGLLVHIGSII